MPAQPGPHDARGESIDCDPRALQLAGQFECKQQVGQLALTVAESLVVVSFTIQVIEVDVAVLVKLRGNHDNAAGRRGLQEVQQEVSEEEVTQVIHAELHFKAIFCLCVGTLIDACVVDEHVNLGFLLKGQRIKSFKITTSEVSVNLKITLLQQTTYCTVVSCDITTVIHFHPKIQTTAFKRLPETPSGHGR